MRTYKVAKCDNLDSYDFDNLKHRYPTTDLVVYNYKNEGYEGTGIAIWRVGKKYGYAYLGHCSCNGPLEDVNSIMYTLPQLKKLAKGYNYEWQYSAPVLEKLDKVLAKEKEKANVA